MKTVNFTRMEDGTREEYEFLDRMEDEYKAGLPERIMESLRKLEHSFSGYQINRLQHSLQTATRAERAGADLDMVVASLCHDIGKYISNANHPAIAAEMIR